MIQPIKQATPSRTKHTALYLAIILLALAVHNHFPWLYWVTLIALVGHALYLASVPLRSIPLGKTMMYCTLALLVIHIAWAGLRTSSYSPTGDTFWRDDQNYYPQAAAIASAWENGDYPEISQKGAPPYLGTLHTGYHRPLAVSFFLFGQSTFAGLLVNAISAALLPLLCAICTIHLWPSSSTSPPRKLRENLPFMAFLMAALHPNQFYWSAYLLKDSFTACIVLVSLALTFAAIARKNPAAGLTAAITILFLFTVRAYAAMSIVVGIACIPLLKLPLKLIVQKLLIFAVTVFLICAYTEPGNQLYEQLRDSLLALTPPNVNSPQTIFTQMIVGIPRLFLSPFAWVFVEDWNPLYGMYPGMWYLYIAILPLSFCGLHYSIKHNIKPAIILISVFGCASVLFLVSVFEGNASRQRYYLEYVCILFAALGLKYPNKYWIIGILAAEAAFAIGQLISLKI